MSDLPMSDRHGSESPGSESPVTSPGLHLPDGNVDAQATQVMARVARTFDLASRFLPRPVRRDVRRLYLVLRTLDDLVDDGDPRAVDAIEKVEAWAAGEPSRGPLAAILDDLVGRHAGLPRDALADFAAGMRADIAGPAHRTEADLARYCYQVAGTVGRAMVALLGVRPGSEPEADLAARALGTAMQRTNILRDLGEDARRGRVYLPDDAFREVGLAPEQGGHLLVELAAWPAATRAVFIGRQSARAEEEYAIGLAGTRHLLSGRRAVYAAGLMYRDILRQIEREEYGGRRSRVVVSRGRKLLLVARASMMPR
jgi:15-cis-phytoene synthase